MDVLIAEDGRLLREGIQALVQDNEKLNVIGLAKDGQEAVRLTKESHPDVVLMGIDLPVLDGIKAAGKMKAQFPDVKVILLAADAEINKLIQGVANGVDGILIKDIYPETLIRAIQDAYYGDVVFSGEVAKLLATSITESTADKRTVFANRMEKHGYSFASRELDILFLIMKGKSNDQIAHDLFINEGTVRNYMTKLYRKLEIGKRKDVISYLKNLMRIQEM